jgi:uncharacterized OsmC-like protein
MTAESQTARADIELIDRLQFATTFPEVQAATALTIDEPPPTGDGAGPNPAALLAAAVGGCLAASFTFCLRKARIDPEGVVARAEARLVRNETGRFRIGDITVDLTVGVSGNDGPKLARCSSLFEDFCIVTESVRRGIPVTVTVRTSDATATSALVPL